MGVSLMEDGWQSAAAFAIGTSHQSSLQGVCQDAHSLQFVESLAAFVDVESDGAGRIAIPARIASCGIILRI
jgi:hypothetical protein